MRGYLNAAIAAALVALLTCVGWQGYQMGRAACEAAHNAETLARIEAGQMLDQDRIKKARERDDLARKLEDQAHADPIIVERCLSPDRVRRLNSLR